MKLTKIDRHAVETAFLLATVTAGAVGVYVIGKSISTLRKFNKALDIYISEHKYRVADYESMQDFYFDEEGEPF